MSKSPSQPSLSVSVVSASCDRNRNHSTTTTNTTNTTNTTCAPSKRTIPKQANNSRVSPWYHQMIAGAGAGMVAAVFVSPLDVARMRIQVARSPASNVDLFGVSLLKQMVKNEGPMSLFSGLGANMLALVPNWVTYFVSYSQYRKHMEPVFVKLFGEKSLPADYASQGETTKSSVAPVLFDISNAVFAGFTTFVVTNPLWLVKARLQVQGLAIHEAKARQALAQAQAQAQLLSPSTSSLPKPMAVGAGSILQPAPVTAIPSTTIPTNIKPQAAETVVYRNTFHALATIYRTEGFRALYQGLAPQLFGLIHAAIHFPLYESLKRKFTENNVRRAREQYERQKACAAVAGVPRRKMPGKTLSTEEGEVVALSTSQIIVASTVSKLIACLAAYPHEVLRSRFQTQHYLAALSKDKPLYVYSSLSDAIKTVYKQEGLRGFYRGLTVTLIRSVPACIVTFLTYEKVIQYLAKK